MGAAMFYPRTSVLPTIKTSLPSSINCLTNHPVDDGHQSRFHEHNHCWLHQLPVKQKFIYLTKSRQPCSGAAVPEVAWEQYIDAEPFLVFTENSAFSAATWQQPGGAAGREESWCVGRFWKVLLCPRCRNLSEAAHQCQSAGVAAPLLLLSRPPYIAAGKQMSGHKYAHKLQGKKAVGGAVGVASTVRTAPRISYTM